MSFSRLSPFHRSLFSAFAALFAYGAWAYMVNLEYGFQAAYKAAFTQGIYSFLLTFVMTLLIEGLYRYITTMFTSETTKNSVTWFATCSIVFSSSWWVNVMAGTPEIFNTVILGYVVGGVYTLAYVLGLSAKDRIKNNLTQTQVS